MKPRTYATPAGFKAALEQRLRNSSKSGAELARRRQLLVFDRLLARVTRVLGKAAMVKGGLVLDPLTLIVELHGHVVVVTLFRGDE